MMRARNIKARGLTLKEWAELPDDVPGELVDGVLVEEEVTSFRHDDVVSFLHHFFFGWVVPRGGRVTTPDFKFAVAPKRGRKPDLAVYLSGARLPEPADHLGVLPPDIMVEVISPRPRDARRDRVEKTGEYARFGIRWYWLVDPAIRSIEILELGAKRRYSLMASVSSGILPVPSCRGLKLEVDKLWAQVDRLPHS